jgi:predicted nucleic acid-binding protein
MENPSELLPETNARDRLNNWIAISVALLAAFMAITKVKDDNIVQAMLQAKTDAVDTWSEYQAKRIKHHLLELGRDQTVALRATAPQAAAQLDEQVKHYESEIARYQDEETELQDKARAFEKQYDALNFRDDQFDLSDAFLSVALAMLAVTALTRKKWLLWTSLVFGGFGFIMGLAGLIGWKIHPDWLTKLLS